MGQRRKLPAATALSRTVSNCRTSLTRSLQQQLSNSRTGTNCLALSPLKASCRALNRPGLRNHKKSKDVRDRFRALAQKAYEDNRAKAEAFRTAQSRDQLQFEPEEEEAAQGRAEAEAVAVRQQENMEADREKTELANDSWTWTLGEAVRDLKEVGRGATASVFVGSLGAIRWP